MAEKRDKKDKKKDHRERSRERSRERRGRSRTRREEKDRRDRRARARDGEDQHKKSRHEGTAPPAPPPKAVLTPVAKPATADGDSEESYESESGSDDVEVVPTPASSAPAKTDGVAKPGQGQDDKPSDSGILPSGSRPPPEPVTPPKSKDSTAPESKDSRYKCPVCHRWVGGGPAGSWQHRRSAYHLACYTYYVSEKRKDWTQCQDEGRQWSKTLKEQNTDPPDDSDVPGVGPAKKKRQTQTAPPPIRADPRKHWDDKGPDGHDGGEGSGSAGSSTDSLLLKMWQATVRELAGI